MEETNYYPFGLAHQGYNEKNNTIGEKYKYQYNGKEKQDELGLNVYDYGARNYDAALGRWMNVDPLAEKMPQWNPYTYTFNNPVNFVDPDGRYPFPIYIRSFAPFKTFGGGFDGDGAKRGFTTSLSATSRLEQSFTLDISKKEHGNLSTYSSPSKHPVLGTRTADNDRGSMSNLTYIDNNDGSRTASFSTEMAGHNPLVPGSPDIDVKTYFTMTENENAGTLDISAVQMGDAFPSAETFINDTNGNGVFIGVSPAIGNPYTSLPGKGNKKMMTANFTIMMDDKGVFTGVKQGNTSYSLDNWKKKFENQSTTK
ncbi:RHS repeat-associated core domain-containing protein [Myroides odoratus]|uniref:RHS repeat-associated core domain-containing protein n=1 Tax=Myroides odoratus TaxID=256 RepID=UPI00215D5DBB|nr:RHS repeat-associated core domain-containing protein [Myroides odoratus]